LSGADNTEPTSGETKIRNFTDSVTKGKAFTHTAGTTTVGSKVVVNYDCLAAVSYLDGRAAAAVGFAISLNVKGTSDPNGTTSDETATNPSAISMINRIAQCDTEGAGHFANCNVTMKFNAGDVIRGQCNGQQDADAVFRVHEITDFR